MAKSLVCAVTLLSAVAVALGAPAAADPAPSNIIVLESVPADPNNIIVLESVPADPTNIIVLE